MLTLLEEAISDIHGLVVLELALPTSGEDPLRVLWATLASAHRRIPVEFSREAMDQKNKARLSQLSLAIKALSEVSLKRIERGKLEAKRFMAIGEGGQMKLAL